MNTQDRIRRVATGPADATLRMTPRQRRRFVKKAGRDPYAIGYRDDGMGYPLSKQGFKEVVEVMNPPAAGEEEAF